MNGKRKKKAVRNTKTRGGTESEPKRRRSFSKSFPLALILTAIPVSLAPEAWYWHLNEFTATLSGHLIRLTTALTPVVLGTHISLDGFSVTVVSECSGFKSIALYAAFIVAFPAPRARKWIGFGVGASLLFSANIIRIAAVTIIGRSYPQLADTAHIYLGLLIMLIALVSITLTWCRWVSDPMFLEGPGGFFIRFLLISSPLFLLWIPLNRVYIEVIDGFVEVLFSFSRYRFTIPRSHQLYYQTFTLAALPGLLLAPKGVRTALKLNWLLFGIAAMTLAQAAYRICNVWITAFHYEWAIMVSRVVYVAGVHVLPFGIALMFFVKAQKTKSP